MSVAERYIITNQTQSPSAFCGRRRTQAPAWSASTTPMRTSVSGTTAASPSRLPQANADCFDIELPEPMIIYSGPCPAFLSFEVFDGLAPNIPLLVNVEYSHGLCELEHPDLGVYGRGETCEEAVVDFLEYLVADYRAYAEESDDRLDSHASALASRYRKLLRRV